MPTSIWNTAEEVRPDAVIVGTVGARVGEGVLGVPNVREVHDNGAKMRGARNLR